MERCGSGMWSPGLVGDMEVSLGCMVIVLSIVNSAGFISNFGCHTRGGSVPVTLILGSGRSSKSRRLGLIIKPDDPWPGKIGAGFLGVVNVGVAPEYGTPTTDGLRAIPGTGVKTWKGGLSILARKISSSTL